MFLLCREGLTVSKCLLCQAGFIDCDTDQNQTPPPWADALAALSILPLFRARKVGGTLV